MGLIFNTIVFVLVNIIIGSLLLTSQDITISETSPELQFDDADTELTYGDIKDSTVGVKVSGSDFENTGIPDWFKWVFLLIDGIWLSGIVYGWVRGVS